MLVQEHTYFNFVNSINSEATRKMYEYYISRFLKYSNLDLDSLLRLPQHELSNLIINYLVSLKISSQYKTVIMAAIKHACEMNDIILNWKKLKKFIKSLKIQFNENTNYDSVIEQANREKVDPEYRMYVIPVSFSQYGKELLGRFQHVVSKGWFSVSPVEHKELVTQMRMARFKDNGNLDKSETGSSTFDVFDSTRLALKMFEMSDKR